MRPSSPTSSMSCCWSACTSTSTRSLARRWDARAGWSVEARACLALCAHALRRLLADSHLLALLWRRQTFGVPPAEAPKGSATATLTDDHLKARPRRHWYPLCARRGFHPRANPPWSIDRVAGNEETDQTTSRSKCAQLVASWVEGETESCSLGAAEEGPRLLGSLARARRVRPLSFGLLLPFAPSLGSLRRGSPQSGRCSGRPLHGRATRAPCRPTATLARLRPLQHRRRRPRQGRGVPPRACGEPGGRERKAEGNFGPLFSCAVDVFWVTHPLPLARTTAVGAHAPDPELGSYFYTRMCPRMSGGVLLPDGDVACALPVCDTAPHRVRRSSSKSRHLLPLPSRTPTERAWQVAH